MMIRVFEEVYFRLKLLYSPSFLRVVCFFDNEWIYNYIKCICRDDHMIFLLLSTNMINFNDLFSSLFFFYSWDKNNLVITYVPFYILLNWSVNFHLEYLYLDLWGKLTYNFSFLYYPYEIFGKRVIMLASWKVFPFLLLPESSSVKSWLFCLEYLV